MTDCNEIDVTVEDAVAGMKDLEFNNDNDKISSAAINDSDVIDDKNNFVADDKILKWKKLLKRMQIILPLWIKK